MIDPFSDDADPKRLDGTLPPAATEDGWAKRAVGRRVVLRTLAAVPAIVGASACLRMVPACPTLPASAQHCRHRFCRYHHAR